MRKWDMGQKYEDLKKKIVDEINRLKTRKNIRSIKRLAYLLIYGIQLRNGARISESIEAFYNFLSGNYEKKENKLVTKVRVRKKKYPEYRDIIFPEFIPLYLINKIKNYRLDITVISAKVNCRRILGVNSHTLRYARITYLLERGVNPSIIAKITHHSKINFILEYTQEKIAEKVNLSIY